jgi:hypothetical protein
MHPINKQLDKNEPKQKCDDACKYFKFAHLDTACVLSDVFSVRQGALCAIYKRTTVTNNTPTKEV